MYLKRNASEMIYHILLNQCPTDASYKLLNKCELEQNMLGDTGFCDAQAGPRQLETWLPAFPHGGRQALQ